MKKCLHCYQTLDDEIADFHSKCSRSFFGSDKPPVLSLGKTDLKAIARQIVARSVAVTGVQPKLSLEIEKVDTKNSRLTIVGLWGSYILKPPSDVFDSLPENEDLTMKLAGICGIKTAAHSLIRLQSGELAYITKRFDRIKGKKIHVEDFCQLTETLTEHKYRSSMEKVGKAIRKFSTNTGLDVLAFFELSLFCFITGNADMHLKNFSLIRARDGDVYLSPAYDLVSTRLAMPEDTEQTALTINGKKNKLKKSDFVNLAKTLQLQEKSIEKVFSNLLKKEEKLLQTVEASFLSNEQKTSYIELIKNRMELLR
jgi:serine/threonine-protein kinase HipA